MIIATVDKGKLELGASGDAATIMAEYIRLGVGIAEGFMKQDIPKTVVKAFFLSAFGTLMKRLEDKPDA